jgi:hypothetical protein
MIRQGKLPTCAAYFHKWRSHIYLPPDFETAYTKDEQEMLLAHERQHIAQHDPLIYQLLVAVESVYWFCPAVHKAVRLFQQDRELLCDESVTQIYGKHEYGHVLLKAAEKRVAAWGVVGVVSEAGGLTERIEAFLTPLSASGKTAVAIICVSALLFATSFPGFASVSINPNGEQPYTKPVLVSLYENRAQARSDITSIEEMEKFVLVHEDGVTIDQAGMYEYAISQGMKTDTRLVFQYTLNMRPVLGDVLLHPIGYVFTVGYLQTETIFVPFNTPADRIMDLIFRLL